MSQVTNPASEWIQRWSHLVKLNGSVLDVACGQGRHTRWFIDKNHHVTGVDIDSLAINSIAKSVPSHLFRGQVADIENGLWPFMHEDRPQEFDVVVVTNYLWRPLLPKLLASLASGGVLLYETFAMGNETVGKPSRPDFLLQAGELLQVCKALHIIAFEEGFLESPDRFVQRIAAVAKPPRVAGDLAARHSLPKLYGR